MPDFANSVIYTISSNDPTLHLVYVGSTTDFDTRKTNHESDCYNHNQPKFDWLLYQMIRENGGWDAFTMEIYSAFPCDGREELSIEEERVRMLLDANMNSNRAYSPLKGPEYSFAHYHETKESKRGHITCECGGQYTYYNRYNHNNTMKHQIFKKLHSY